MKPKNYYFNQFFASKFYISPQIRETFTNTQKALGKVSGSIHALQNKHKNSRHKVLKASNLPFCQNLCMSMIYPSYQYCVMFNHIFIDANICTHNRNKMPRLISSFHQTAIYAVQQFSIQQTKFFKTYHDHDIGRNKMLNFTAFS